MSSNIWISLGVLAGAFATFALPYGFHLKSEEKAERRDSTLRERARREVGPDQVAIYQFNNNQFIFQGAQPKNDPGTSSLTQKKEAKIIVSLLPSFEIQASHNISSVVDNGAGDLTVIFVESFPHKNYYVQISGDRSVTVTKVTKERGSVRIQFDEAGLNWLQVVCATD